MRGRAKKKKTKSRRTAANIVKAKNAAVRRRKTQAEVAIAMGAIAAQTIKEAMVPGYSRGPVVPDATEQGGGSWYNGGRIRTPWLPPNDTKPVPPVQKIVKAVEPPPFDFTGMSEEEGEALAATLLPIIEKNNREIRKLAAIVEVVKAAGTVHEARALMEEMAAVGNPLFLSDGRLNPEFMDDDLL